jgi:Spy/CpxP family protein refolding chaperone
MRTTKVAIVLILLFVLTIAAGAVMGRLLSAPPLPQTQQAGVVGGSPLSDELRLSPEQAAQMRPIWEAARDIARECAQNAERIQREHEEQLAALLTDEQKLKYEKLTQANHRRIAALDARRREAFGKAVAHTRNILRDDQWRAYEQILRNQVGTVPGAVDEAAPPEQ